MSSEAEMFGITVGLDQLRVIRTRYHFASSFTKDKRVLEIGCGAGLGLHYLTQDSQCLVAGDYSKANLRMAQQYYPSATLVQFDAHQLPFRDNSFDVVVSMATVIYLDLIQFFAECYRILDDNGVLVFCTPNKDQPHFQPSKESKNYYSVPELTHLSRQFHTEIFAAFPISDNQYSWDRTIVGIVSGLLTLLPKDEQIKSYLSHHLMHTVSLMPDTLESIAPLIPQPIDSSHPDYEHRVLYVKCLKEAR